MRYVFQVIGASLLLAGITLFFFPTAGDNDQTLKKEVATLEKENQKLQQKVKQLEKEAKQVNKEEEKETSEQAKEKPKATIKTVIAIEEGSDSVTVANSLEEAKIIDNAKAFNDFLVDTGYASKIRIGEYEINETMTFQQIAETITKTASN